MASCAPADGEPHPADGTELASWHYPSDAQFRRYQFDAVEAALGENTLVSFPTGLGKTLVGAVVMANYARWFPQSLVAFIAPTRPLVAQQLDAVVATVRLGRGGRGDAALLTGDTPPTERRACYASCRALFCTAQVLANDLASGACPPRRLALLVVDEAHHAQGEHAYCQIARALFAAGGAVRILALSATAGKDVAAVQRVLTALRISRLLAMDEDDPFVQRHCHERRVHTVVVARAPAAGRGAAALAARKALVAGAAGGAAAALSARLVVPTAAARALLAAADALAAVAVALGLGGDGDGAAGGAAGGARVDCAEGWPSAWAGDEADGAAAPSPARPLATLSLNAPTSAARARAARRRLARGDAAALTRALAHWPPCGLAGACGVGVWARGCARGCAAALRAADDADPRADAAAAAFALATRPALPCCGGCARALAERGRPADGGLLDGGGAAMLGNACDVARPALDGALALLAAAAAAAAASAAAGAGAGAGTRVAGSRGSLALDSSGFAIGAHVPKLQALLRVLHEYYAAAAAAAADDAAAAAADAADAAAGASARNSGGRGGGNGGAGAALASRPRAIIFCESRTAVAHVLSALHLHARAISGGALRAAPFIGQNGQAGGAKRSAGDASAPASGAAGGDAAAGGGGGGGGGELCGLSQRQQMETLAAFAAGSLDVLVATCIGEEGLHVSEVALLICYDVTKSPVRTMQRLVTAARAARGCSGRRDLAVCPGPARRRRCGLDPRRPTPLAPPCRRHVPLALRRAAPGGRRTARASSSLRRRRRARRARSRRPAAPPPPRARRRRPPAAPLPRPSRSSAASTPPCARRCRPPRRRPRRAARARSRAARARASSCSARASAPSSRTGCARRRRARGCRCGRRPRRAACRRRRRSRRRRRRRRRGLSRRSPTAAAARAAAACPRRCWPPSRPRASSPPTSGSPSRSARRRRRHRRALATRARTSAHGAQLATTRASARMPRDRRPTTARLLRARPPRASARSSPRAC
jgi:ERCC4-related helicase